jgi:hypothetical protein
MHVQKFALSPPSLEELAQTLREPLRANFKASEVSVVACPDLRQAPFGLAAEGLAGDEKIADVGGRPNLIPQPRLNCHWSLTTDIARAMEMAPARGTLMGAGAGPFHVIGQNCELVASISWQGGFGDDQGPSGGGHVVNRTSIAKIDRGSGAVCVGPSPSVDCGLMANLYGSAGEPGPVLKITARGRTGEEASFTECIRSALRAAYGADRAVSLGGVFLVRRGRALYHVMPDFPPKPFDGRKDVDAWLTFHEFDGGPMVCLSVLHSADPEDLCLRMEHTHCFSADAMANAGGHYHHDVEVPGGDEIEYEAYFNAAKTLYRLDRPS